MIGLIVDLPEDIQRCIFQEYMNGLRDRMEEWETDRQIGLYERECEEQKWDNFVREQLILGECTCRRYELKYKLSTRARRGCEWCRYSYENPQVLKSLMSENTHVWEFNANSILHSASGLPLQFLPIVLEFGERLVEWRWEEERVGLIVEWFDGVG